MCHSKQGRGSLNVKKKKRWKTNIYWIIFWTRNNMTCFTYKNSLITNTYWYYPSSFTGSKIEILFYFCIIRLCESFERRFTVLFIFLPPGLSVEDKCSHASFLVKGIHLVEHFWILPAFFLIPLEEEVKWLFWLVNWESIS